MTLIFLLFMSGVIKEAIDLVILFLLIGIISLFFGVINLVLFSKFTIWNKYPKKVKVEEEKAEEEKAEEVKGRSKWGYLKTIRNFYLLLPLSFMGYFAVMVYLHEGPIDWEKPMMVGIIGFAVIIKIFFWYWVFVWISRTPLWRFISETFKVENAKVMKEGKELDHESPSKKIKTNKLSRVDELQRLSILLDDGKISKDEYEELKKDFL